ncbi:MAG: nucleotide sugar dehydrogenase [Chloroflexi bacterium]|nr:nucleotide sugar dehydrogenase [Chloroflexota bacterium]
MVVQQEAPARALERKLSERTATVGVLGLGYAGLPMAVEIARAGFAVTGLDVNRDRVAAIKAGHSPVSDVASEAVRTLTRQGLLRATDDFDALAELDAAIICVPTPLDESRRPDLRYVEAATQSIAERLHPGMLVALQSTCAPGTTRECLLPILSESGLTVGDDYFLVFAPERIDPGNTRYTVRNTPKLIGGITPRCTALAQALYRAFVEELAPVSSPEVAEMSKLVENTFRFINISFANELARVCDRMGISAWEVIDAAATKPFAFLPHYPGAGVGGHCIPIVPFYLQAVAERYGLAAELIEASGRINDGMPRFVVEKMDRLLAERGLDPAEARVLLLGVTYKGDVADLRESPALQVLERLLVENRRVTYHDPLIEEVEVGARVVRSTPLDAQGLGAVDCVVLLAPHRSVDYDLLVEQAPLILDTCNWLKRPDAENVVPL